MKIVILMLLIIGVCVTTCTSQKVVLPNNKGQIYGVNTGKTFEYLGIPFATANRWELPQEVPAFSQPFQATAYGPTCPQHCELPVGVCPTVVQSENCLNLNVFAPVNATPSSKLPVMFFIYGGGYLLGGQETPLYNGSSLA